ncbi:MAG: putative selenate reductase subunit YgfK [Ignavibacteriaceae bacterium]|nr:putative selenate reductase subunit YgfK [Ignavibacteriaceae bacterium]
MSDQMTPIPFNQLFDWMITEYKNEQTIFGIHKSNFFFKKNSSQIIIFNEALEMPLGPAAGPHTQLTQNIITSYLTGGRFFELKTVQILDELKVDKPCIDAQDEGYNVEWSQELKLEQSYEEYLKAWFLLHVLKELFGFSRGDERGFVFNMSVGYNLEGIKTDRMDNFIENLKDSSSHEKFIQYKNDLIAKLNNEDVRQTLRNSINSKINFDKVIFSIQKISPNISNSVTLSTMHGCPPTEIEAIAKYLIEEKGLHTYVKLNPTLLGYEKATSILHQLGFQYIELDRTSFEHDINFADAVPMLKRLQSFAKKNNRQFGVKLSNTLGVKNRKKVLAGDDMYMSGRSLFPLTMNVARMLAEEFNGELPMSFSGGATINNVQEILETGISPITLVTDLLKPGGYSRIFQMSEKIEKNDSFSKKIDVEKIKTLAANSLIDLNYKKEKREISTVKIPTNLEMFDCYVAPCEEACPIHQDVAAYIRLVEEGKYDEAFEVIVSKNPLPFITGYICDHQCQAKCTRWDYDDPVQIREMKKIAAQFGYQNYFDKISSKDKLSDSSVAIIGAGPAGLSCGFFLAKAGLDVTIFERSSRAGGTVQNVIPDFRLPQTAIDADIEFIKKHGVKFQFGTDENFSIEKLKTDGYKYIFIGIGATKSSPIQLEEGSDNVQNAIEFLWHFNNKEKIPLGKNVAIVGGGNSAMDAARASKRIAGVENVYIVYRRTKEFMPADKEELDAALEDGVIFKELLLPVSHNCKILKCQKMKLDEVGKDGRRNVTPLENEFVDLDIDNVISAIGESVDYNILSDNKITFDQKKNILIDKNSNETMLENVFIGGDAYRGPSTVVESIADGKKAAEAILKQENASLPILNNFSNLFNKSILFENVNDKKGFIEGTKTEAQSEASRCLSCSFICNKCVDVCPNRANVTIKIDGFKDAFQILHIDGMCNDCGNCETFCPHIGAPYKDKLMLFWSEKEMRESKNNGFFLSKMDGTAFFLIKKENEISELEIDTQNYNVKTIVGSIDESEVKLISETFKNYRYLFL